MARKRKEIVIPKEKAVFWLDKHGCWNNVHGKFQHRKIIDYFNASIKKDQGGYYLCQATEDRTEKVYFRYEDTALFVFDVVEQQHIVLVLNTGQKVSLRPDKLFMKDDNLYADVEGDLAKFVERALIKIADRIENAQGRYYLRSDDERYEIREVQKIADL